MFIFWGRTTRQRVVDQGSFRCPGCRKTTTYSLVQLTQYFTVYFIPLAKTNTLGEITRCNECGREFDAHSLWDQQAGRTGRAELNSAPWKCDYCNNHNNGDHCLGCNAWLCSNCRGVNRAEMDRCLHCGVYQ